MYKWCDHVPSTDFNLNQRLCGTLRFAKKDRKIHLNIHSWIHLPTHSLIAKANTQIYSGVHHLHLYIKTLI